MEIPRLIATNPASFRDDKSGIERRKRSLHQPASPDNLGSAKRENAMPNENHGTDLFERIRTTRSMRRLKPDPVPTDPKDPRSRGLCPERWKYAALAIPGNPRSKGQRGCRDLVQTSLE
jgi:hypothetical protein